MSNIKKLRKAQAAALSKQLPNQLGVLPLSSPYVAQSIAENPCSWVELPVSGKECTKIACGSAIQHPILGCEYEILHSGSDVEMILIQKFVSFLSSCAAVRFFKYKSDRLFLCTDADKATIGSALHNAAKEILPYFTPFHVAEITK